ncbi:AAA family ATPase [Streptococcus mutans]|uniref:McrB family protein n=1 Tax=Streptococcus mutans TaxID=1309 RepID=UPI00081BFB78|nr:AAA family ATPase [Streptococcus mutans]AYO47374.1 endonuclease [Streptococcus mutans]MCB4940851.1 AAA family ATPase [Streptococcus mutans]MCB5068278.1 AAA family ATPase [Streptococcus mutans]MCB5151059.1 AAA family ATPase [Streptococcus mutans]MCB5159119.1 AAA family ATPase [Streptococcus mutans]
MENREVKVWKISVGGTNKIKLHKKAFANKILYIGFTQIEEKDYHFNGEKNPRKSENQVALLQHGIEVGDFVLVPRTNLYASFLAKITKPYHYVKEDGESAEFPRRFEIEPISQFGKFKLKNLKEKQWNNTTVGELTYGSLNDLYDDFNVKQNTEENSVQKLEDMKNMSKYGKQILNSYNLILRGAPGTGKTYLAKQIAEELTDGNEDQIGFVQFHPSYDYTDFVEGLRPSSGDDGQIGFKLQDGIFREFCKKAKKATESGGQDNFDEAWDKFFEAVNDVDPDGSYDIKTLTGKPMHLIAYMRNEMSGVMEKGSASLFYNKAQCYNIYKGDSGVPKGGLDNYRKAVVKHLKEKYGLVNYVKPTETTTDKKFVFIIDEINRGEISKIFGELFFSIDPDYRGEKGAVSTQYANLHETDEKFYIPENVYIIGTMNDIDRSVDTFDFAMRRRFRFVEIKAADTMGMWENNDEFDNDKIEEARIRLTNLNKAISNTEGLNSHYHIGPSYFLKLKDLDYDYDILWSDYLEPLLKDYLRGSYDETDSLDKLKDAYNNEEETDETH